MSDVRAKFTLITALLAVALGTSPALTAAGTVQIGGESKPASGTITALVAGDTACYLTLEDDGESVDLMAAFEICEQESALVGHRVALSYSMENVLAAECQGDMDCGKSDRVALVSAVKVQDGGGSAAADDGEPESFCSSREMVVFACRIGAKLVSVCAANEISATSGYLQYRFGKPNAGNAMELMLPNGETVPPEAAVGEAVPFAGGGGSWLRFRNGAYGYAVYTGIGRWGPNGETAEKQGVLVTKGGKTVANLRCTGDLTSELGPDWYDNAGVTANGEEFEFPD